jgi:glucose/arabinose dehydrogenase
VKSQFLHSAVKFGVVAAVLTLFVVTAVVQRTAGSAVQTTGSETQVLETNDHRIRVVTLAKGLSYPWSLTFLPDGSIFVTERPGRLRIMRNGVLQTEPVAGVPEVRAINQGGLMEIALHPNFAQNNFVYMTYSKAGPGESSATTALYRARFDGKQLREGRDIFVAEAWSETNLHFGSRLAFGRDGMLYMTIGERNQRQRAQDTNDHAGKILRLRDDGTVPNDNPFVGKAGYKPEIYSYGHRSPQGLAIHPQTGELWESEHGPLGGDEVNVIQAGRNYGWPVITYGREYNGDIITDQPVRAGMEQPRFFWVPAIGISGLTFYTGDRFPAWKGHMFVGALSHLQVQLVRLQGTSPRVMERESILAPLRQRVRDVRQGPDGFLYVATDSDYSRRDATGMILRIEPAS